MNYQNTCGDCVFVARDFAKPRTSIQHPFIVARFGYHKVLALYIGLLVHIMCCAFLVKVGGELQMDVIIIACSGLRPGYHLLLMSFLVVTTVLLCCL